MRNAHSHTHTEETTTRNSPPSFFVTAFASEPDPLAQGVGGDMTLRGSQFSQSVNKHCVRAQRCGFVCSIHVNHRALKRAIIDFPGNCSINRWLIASSELGKSSWYQRRSLLCYECAPALFFFPLLHRSWTNARFITQSRKSVVFRKMCMVMEIAFPPWQCEQCSYKSTGCTVLPPSPPPPFFCLAVY